MVEESKDKEEILKELLLSEEDTLKKLRNMVDKTKTLVKIDHKSKNIVVTTEYNFSNPEKILLYLVGKYFSKELGITDTKGMDIQEFENITKIKKTTLSKPLGVLLYSGYIEKDDQKRYYIQHYKIEEVVTTLYLKYIEKNPEVKELKYKTKRKKGGKNEQ